MRNFLKDHLAVLSLAILAMPLAVSAIASDAGLLGIGIQNAGNGVLVNVEAAGDYTTRSFRVENPDRLVIDLEGAVKAPGAISIDGDGQLVSSVRTSQYRSLPNPVARIVVDLVGNPSANVIEGPNGLQILVGLSGSQGEAAVKFSQSGVAVEPAAAFENPGNRALASDLAPDAWQDGSGIARISQPDRREEDASYSRTMSINMQSADIRTILRAVADFSGRNIIASPEVTGSVTVALTEVPWREALDVILRAHSFAFVEESGIIRVDTAENLRDEELAAKTANKRSDELEALITRVVPIDFANADEIQGAVKGMVSARGSVEVDDRTNSLIVTDIPGSVDILQKLCRELDTKTPQVHIDALLVDLDTRRSQELGIDWGILNAAPSGGNVVGDLTVSNPINEVAGQLRVGAVHNWAELRGTVQALAKENVANIISNPRITTTNNREASILVGQKIPLITTDVAGNPITRLETIGIRLVVTPHINSERQITLDVHPEVSDLSSQATVQGGVIINTSEADTRVLVNNRETAVIAGLIRSVKSTFSAGVPILKDLPVLGALFRTESVNDEQRELVVFLTPSIVGDQAEMLDRHRELKQQFDDELMDPGTRGK